MTRSAISVDSHLRQRETLEHVDWESPCGPSTNLRPRRGRAPWRYETSAPLALHLAHQPCYPLEVIDDQHLRVSFACGCSAIVQRSEIRVDR